MSEQWYYRQENQTRGPLLRSQLVRLLQAGELDRDTWVWRQGLADWIPLESLGVLAGNDEPIPPPVCPPPPPQAPAPPSRRQSSRRPVQEGFRWGLFAGMSVAALVLAGGLGWMAREAFAPRRDGLNAAAHPDRPRRRASAPRQPPAADTESPSPEASPLADPEESGVDVPVPAAAAAPTASASDPGLPPVGTDIAVAPPAAGAENPSPAPSSPTSTTPAQAPARTLRVLYQEIDVHRSPRFSILGAETVQHLHYQIMSELRPGEADEHGARKVAQTILDTRLVKSDVLSRSMFEKSLKDLIGWQFSLGLNAGGEVVYFASAPPDGIDAVPIKPAAGEGFLLTSVMDEAGWKELAQMSFFVPNPKTRADEPMVRQMTHDFGPLGSWTGITRLVPRGTERGLLRVDYSHEMTYQPPDAGRGGLPFAVKDARFTPEVAGGTIFFDTRARRVHSAQDRFLVRGEVLTDLLGESAVVQVQEEQAITIQIHEQNPWIKE